jgi:hypothetical protein
MTIYDRLKKGINSRINKGLLDDFYVEKTKNQLDIFFYGDRITQEQYKELMDLINSHLKINIKRA